MGLGARTAADMVNAAILPRKQIFAAGYNRVPTARRSPQAESKVQQVLYYSSAYNNGVVSKYFLNAHRCCLHRNPQYTACKLALELPRRSRCTLPAGIPCDVEGEGRQKRRVFRSHNTVNRWSDSTLHSATLRVSHCRRRRPARAYIDSYS